jgi:hypothetical protein
MSTSLAEVAAATEALAVTRRTTAACARCGGLFTYERAAVKARAYCDPCREQKAREGKQLAKERYRQRRAGELPPPDLPPMPPPPDWSRAFCQRAPSHMRPYWTSTIPAEREAASHACRTRCEVEPECALWSLALPLNDSAVYAGLSQIERRRRRRAMLDELARQATEGLRLRLPWASCARPGWLLVVQDCARPRARPRLARTGPPLRPRQPRLASATRRG